MCVQERGVKRVMCLALTCLAFARLGQDVIVRIGGAFSEQRVGW